MKRVLPLFIIAVLFCNARCEKDKDEEPQLPPETTTGAMTFGCKVNGKVFVPKDGNGRPGLYVQYVYLGPGPGGGWYLNIPAIDWRSSPIPSVHIETDSLLLTEGMTYQFKTTKGNPKAFYAKTIEYHKLDNDIGELKITKFDQGNNILSGTFFFIGTNTTTGEKISITEGRFDIRY